MTDSTPKAKKSLTPITNCWAIYRDETMPDGFAEFHRPQDWGDPRWMYRVYVLEAQGYRNTVHCWLEGPTAQEYEHLKMFAGLLTTILQPGSIPELSGRDYLAEDDFWEEAWGAMPPTFEEEDEDFEVPEDLHGGHKDVWIDVDGESVRMLADPNMDDKTRAALAELVRAARKAVDDGTLGGNADDE